MVSFFQHHHNWRSKTAGGLSYLFVAWDERQKFKCFYVRTERGHTHDISVPKTLKHWGKSPDWITEHETMAHLNTAARHEIEDQIRAFRKSVPIVRSRLSGRTLDPAVAHVDHWNPTFKDLLRNWKITLANDADLSSREVGQGRRMFYDRTVATSWKEYHKRHSTLVFLSAHENMSKGAKNGSS